MAKSRGPKRPIHKSAAHKNIADKQYIGVLTVTDTTLKALSQSVGLALAQKQKQNQQLSKKARKALEIETKKAISAQTAQVKNVQEMVKVQKVEAEAALEEAKEDALSIREQQRLVALFDKEDDADERSIISNPKSLRGFAKFEDSLEKLHKQLAAALLFPKLISQNQLRELGNLLTNANRGKTFLDEASTEQKKSYILSLRKAVDAMQNLKRLGALNIKRLQDSGFVERRALREAKLELARAVRDGDPEGIEDAKASVQSAELAVKNQPEEFTKRQQETAERRREEAKEAKQRARLDRQWKSTKFLFGDRDDKGTVNLRGSAQRALSLVGKGVSDKLFQAKDFIGSTASRMGKSALSNTYGRGVRALTNFGEAHNLPMLVAAVNTGNKFLGGLVTTVKDVSTDTMKWISKKLGFLSGMLLRFIRNPLRSLSGGSGLGDLIGMAALIPTLIAPILAGINSELESKYGEHWFKDFLASKWDAAWDFLVVKIKDLLGISKDTGLSQLPDAIIDPSKTQKLSKSPSLKGLAGPLPFIAGALSNLITGNTGPGVATNPQSGQSDQSSQSSQSISDKLSQYFNSTKTNTNTSPISRWSSTINAVGAPSNTVNSLAKDSIGNTAVINNAGNITNNNAGNSTSTGDNLSINPRTLLVTPKVTAGRTSAAPMESPSTTPRTMDAPSAPAAPARDAGATGGKGIPGMGLKVGMIPNNMVDDSLLIISSGILTA